MSEKTISITIEELAGYSEGSFALYDTRSAAVYDYGTITGAVNLPDILLAADRGELPREKRIILFSGEDEHGKELAAVLCEKGYDAAALLGGYEAWLCARIEDTDRSREIEQSITARRCYKEKLFHRFTKAIVEYEMIQPGDKIAVCISGGKDSMLMAKLFQELKRHDKFPFELVFLVMDPGYRDMNRRLIEINAKTMGIPITVFETSVFDAVYKIDKSPCYLCARMRRGYLYQKAQSLGCNKIALGHHYDDVIETVLMGMLWGGQMQTMMPKLHSSNYQGMELIRPMYYIREEDIKAWRDDNDLYFLQCACRFTENCAVDDASSDSKRMETKRLIQELKKTNPRVEANIFHSTHNVNIDTVIAYKKDGVTHHFLEDYSSRKDPEQEVIE